MRTLEADWAYLTRPDRLVAQAQALGMTRAGVTRIVDIERIGRRKQLELSRRPMPITLPSGGSAEFRVKPIATFEIAAGGSGR